MKKQKPNRPKVKYGGFHPGSYGGCEAMLYEFREQAPPDDVTCDLPLSKRISSSGVVLIAALTLEEALDYLRFSSPTFDVHTVTSLGLISMVSGTPLD